MILATTQPDVGWRPRVLRIAVPLIGVVMLGGSFATGSHAFQDDDQFQLAGDVRETLRKNCHSCHGEGGSNEGGLNYILDLKRLVATEKVVPSDIAASDLLSRIRDGGMPPEGSEPRPTPGEIALIEKWIAAGAPLVADAEREFIDDGAILRSIRDDLRNLRERDRRFTRYFTMTHLYNAGRSEDELETYRIALGKLVNSLSWERNIVQPAAIDPAETVFRIDIRDLRWKSETWNRMLDWYPYGYQRVSAAHREIVELTQAALPFIRADWFVAVASKPPLYHDVLELPETLQGLQDLLRIDFAVDVRQERVARAGFNESGVSEFPRIIERHAIADGACWVSYDFSGSAGERNFFARPLSFSADGGEIIFNLPNGLQAYFLADGEGNRLDKAPTNIVKDPSQPDAAVVNGVSCMRCHAAGIIPKRDQVRPNAIANSRAFEDQLDSIRALYPEADEFDRLLEEDRRRFADALSELDMTRLSVTGEPVFNMAQRFDNALDLQLAAAEVGLMAEELDRRLGADAVLQRNLGTLRISGGTVKRDAFEAVFGLLVEALRLGTPLERKFLLTPSSVTPPATSSASIQSLRSGRQPGSWYTFGNRTGWPSYLEKSVAIASRDGLRFKDRSYIRTKDRTFLDEDFTFEIVLSLTRQDHIAFVGLGEGRGRQYGGEPNNSVNLRIHAPSLSDGLVGLSNVGPGGTRVGRIATEGTHRVIVTKIGDSVTFAIDVDDDGQSPDDLSTTIPNIRDYAPFLRGKNTHLFFGGSGAFQKLRLTLGAPSGSLATASHPASAATRLPGSASGASDFDFSTALLGKSGLTVRPRTVVRTRSGTYLQRDFDFDVLVTIPEQSTREPLDHPVFIGIGEGTYDRLHEVERCVRLRMNPPRLGEGTMILARTGADGRLDRGSKQNIGQIRHAGTHKVSIRKQGNSVTFAVDVDNDGESPDDFESTIPDLFEYATFLHSKNGFLFFGGDATFKDYRVERSR